MASSKQQFLSIYGAFYLPVLSLAVLTGFTFSVILPPALSFLIPAMESAFLISLPLLWDAFLSWVTPPCLFVLLNGIIVILTASSGVFSCSESSSGSDFYTNLLGKVENLQKQSTGALMADFAAADSYTNLLAKMENVHKENSAALMAETSASASSQGVVCTGRACEVCDAHGGFEAKRSKFFEDEEKGDNGDDERSLKLSELSMESRSFSLASSESRIYEEEEEDDGDERPSRLSKLAMANKSFSFPPCREEDGCVQMKGRSEPSSPQFATPSKNSVIRRALSIDSASFHDDQVSSSSSESLSDEAFRKRIEDFISKMNAQLRSEAK